MASDSMLPIKIIFQILEREQKRIAAELKAQGAVSADVQEKDVMDTTREMLSLLPEAKRIQTQRVRYYHNTIDYLNIGLSRYKV
jgi:hypothetical protein